MFDETEAAGTGPNALHTHKCLTVARPLRGGGIWKTLGTPNEMQYCTVYIRLATPSALPILT
jgi:hypothetical protein